MDRQITAHDVADHLVWLAHQHGSFVSNLKLQKLLYYAQAWHLALNGRPLFADRLEAWVHGPVVPSVYHRFKQWGYRSIDEDLASPGLPDEVQEFLRELADEYMPLDAYELELMSHRETPWQNARGALAPDAPSRAVLAEDDMREYFRRRMDASPA